MRLRVVVAMPVRSRVSVDTLATGSNDVATRVVAPSASVSTQERRALESPVRRVRDTESPLVRPSEV